MKQTNFTKLCNIAMDSNSDIYDMFKETEISTINYGVDVWVVSARDSMFSGWGMSKGKNNHVFCICWSREQADAIESSLRNLKNMSFISRSSLENFISVRTKHYRGTWSIKNGNDCFAWNNHIIKER